MRRMTYFVMALAMVLGLAQCKKEQPVTPQNEGVMITLNVGDNSNGSRANVEPDATSQVTFESGDEIYVAYNGEYVGYLVHNGSNFEGFVTITPVTPSQPLYFYYLGDNHRLDAADSEGKIRGCTATISDQHLYPHLPVISMGKSIDAEGSTVYYEEGMTSFSSRLYNKCSLMKFNVSTLSTADICITGMNNKVTVDFGKVNEHGDGLGSNPTNQGFSYSQDTDGGLIQMAGSSDAERWVIVLPQTELGEGDNGSAYSTDGIYSGKRPPIHAIESNKWYHEGEDIISLTLDQYSSDVVDLATLRENREVQNGQIIINALSGNYKISIASGATVTLKDATINCLTSGAEYAGITCENDATILLEGTNTVVGGLSGYGLGNYPGIYIAKDHTLTIDGTGTLNASSNGWACGIGGGLGLSCGNIEIQGGNIEATGGSHAAGIGSGGGVSCGNITISGGTVTANGGSSAAGIGSGNGENNYASCGNISISGGIVEATGGQYAAGIGSGYGPKASCGTITITDGVTSVTATKGSYATNSIGAGLSGTCGTVTFDNVVMYNGSSWTTTPTNGGTYGGLSLAITTTTNTNDTWTLTPYVAPVVPTGAIDARFNVGTAESPKWVYFSEGNLQYTQSTTTWSFMEHQYDMVETTGMNVGTNYANQDIVSLFCWGTGNNPTKTEGGAAEYEIFTDWGTNTIYSGTTATSGWRTLTRDEWNNLFANHQYGYVMIFNGSQLICGVAIDPSSTTSLNTSHNNWSNNLYTTGLDAFIADAEAGGWLFLPAAGLRSGTNVSNVGTVSSCAGYYWSSTNEYNSLLGCYQSHYVWFNGSGDAESLRSMGFIGYSVRLVKDAE